MSFFKPYWPLILGLLTLVMALLCFSAAWSQLTKYQVVFYYFQESTFLLACFIIPLCVLLAVIQIRRFTRFEGSRQGLISLGICMFMLLGANVIACGALSSMHHTYHNLTISSLDGHLYRLDTIDTGVWSDFSEDLLLWECESSGWFCRIIYDQDYYSDMVPKLNSDPKTNTLALTINNKVVFVTNP
jgi:hypothetical protein